MKDQFSSKRFRLTNRHNHKSQRKENTPFTTGFYGFLLGLTIIIALSFGVLFYLGSRDSANSISTSEPSRQIAQ